MQFELLLTLHPLSILFWVILAGFAILLVFVLYIVKYGGIGVAAQIYYRGGVVKQYRCIEDEKSIHFKGMTFSKVIIDQKGKPVPLLDKDGKPIKDEEGRLRYKPAAQPATMWKRIRPYRVFRCQEGYPTVLSWEADAPITEVTAQDLNMLSRGAMAQGLGRILMQAAKQVWWILVIMLLFGLTIGLLIHPMVFP